MTPRQFHDIMYRNFAWHSSQCDFQAPNKWCGKVLLLIRRS